MFLYQWNLKLLYIPFILSIFYGKTSSQQDDDKYNLGNFTIFASAYDDDSTTFLERSYAHNKIGTCGIIFDVTKLLIYDHICDLTAAQKVILCRKIFPRFLMHVINESELPVILDNHPGDEIPTKSDKEPRVKIKHLVIDNQKTACHPYRVYVYRDTMNQNMFPCVTTFNINNSEKSLTYYIAQTNDWRMPLWLSGQRNVYLYQKNGEVETVKRKWKESQVVSDYLEDKTDGIKEGDLVQLVGESLDFDLAKLKDITE